MFASTKMGTNPMELPNANYSQMNILLYNFRGALNGDFKRRLLEMVMNHFSSIMIITKTRMGGDKATKIIEGLPFDGFFITETIGYAEGLWLL